MICGNPSSINKPIPCLMIELHPNLEIYRMFTSNPDTSSNSDPTICPYVNRLFGHEPSGQHFTNIQARCSFFYPDFFGAHNFLLII
jgi:hypothetical protein